MNQQDLDSATYVLAKDFFLRSSAKAILPSARSSCRYFTATRVGVSASVAGVQNTLKTLVTDSGEPDTEAILEISILAEDGNKACVFTGKTTNPIIAERGLRLLNE
jgi:hypothetical protein